MLHDLKVEYVNVDDLIFADYNPRKATEKQFKDLCENIETFGFVDPVLVNSADNRKNIIIGGHFRVRVARHLGIAQVPVIYINIPEVEKEKELNVRLNKNTGEWDFEMLANVFDVEELKLWGFEDFEFGISSVSQKMENKEIEITGESFGIGGGSGEKKTCPHCGGEL